MCKDQLTQTQDTLHQTQAELQAALTKCRSLEKHEAEVKETKDALYKSRRELELALQRCQTLEAKSSRRFSIDCFKDSPADVLFYTGLPSYEHFMSLFRFLNPGENGENVKFWATTYSDKATKAGRRWIFLLLISYFCYLSASALDSSKETLLTDFEFPRPRCRRCV